MTAPDDLLRAILANPDDDNLRLVFADKLDDCGEAEHAEFVRVQCELAKCPLDEAAANSMAGYSHNQNSVRYATSIARLRRRERELLEAHGYQWAGEAAPFIGPPKDWLDRFRRGFIAEVRLLCADWLSHGPALMRRQPIEKCVLTDREPCHNTAGVWVWGKTGTGILINWPGYLPKELYDLLSSNTDPISFIRGYGAAYPTESAALDALSTAALLWARQTEPATTSA